MNLQVKVKHAFQGQSSKLVHDLSVNFSTPRYYHDFKLVTMNLQVKVKHAFQGQSSKLVHDLSVNFSTPRYYHVLK